MGWKKIGGALKRIAPVAAQVATSGFLGAGVARDITAALGLKPDASEADVEAKLASASPEQLVALREIEAKTKRHAANVGFKTRELETQERKIDAADRDSARKREIAVQDSTPRVLTYFTFATLSACMILLIWGMYTGKNVDPTIAALLGTAIGIFGSNAKQIGNYYFGSSQGSKDKDLLIQRAIEGQAKPKERP